MVSLRIKWIDSIMFTDRGFSPIIALLLLGEVFLNVLIILKVKYTEIDWIAYMQEVGGVMEGELDYSKLKGDTGPLVYPAGFVYIYSILYWITNQGRDVLLAQFLFAAFYLVLIYLVFRIYQSSGSDSIPPWTLPLLCLSQRIHSIFVLRLFNDGIAMLLLYASILLFIRNRWSLGCFLFSWAVSVKMNILLFAPGLFIILLKTFGFWRTIPKLAICASLQLVLGAPFLLTYPWSYLKGSFDFGRQFFHIWSVNFQFLPESIFLDKKLAIGLLVCHITVLLLFVFKKWCRSEGGVLKASQGGYRVTPEHIVLLMFQSNFIGIVFARSLHPQFYSWYFHTLPFLLWHTDIPLLFKFVVLGGIEYVWNDFPSNPKSSLILVILHSILLVAMWRKPLPNSLLFHKSANQKKDDSNTLLDRKDK